MLPLALLCATSASPKKGGDMDFKGRFSGFFSNNEKIGNPKDDKLDLVVMLCMPSIDGRQHFTHTHLWSRVSQRVRYTINVASESTYLDFGRNKIASTAKEISVERFKRLPDYYFWVDEDNIIPPDAFERLYAHNKDIVGGLYARKTNYDWCMKETEEYRGWEDRRDSLKDGLVECRYIGFGAMLIKGEVFEKLDFPWFKQDTTWVKHDGERKIHEVGEDVYFCDRAREAGYKVWCDTKVEVGHMGAVIYPRDTYIMRRIHKVKSDNGDYVVSKKV